MRPSSSAHAEPITSSIHSNLLIVASSSSNPVPTFPLIVALAAGLALHLLFVFAFFPLPLDLAAVGGAELELAIRFAPAVIATPAALAALVLPGIGGGGAGREWRGPLVIPVAGPVYSSC